MRWKAKTKHIKTYKDGVLKVGKEMERQREREREREKERDRYMKWYEQAKRPATI